MSNRRDRMVQRIAYVTGGMGGIGTAICRRFHDMKATR